jgi:hypothetical protein
MTFETNIFPVFSFHIFLLFVLIFYIFLFTVLFQVRCNFRKIVTLIFESHRRNLLQN